MFKYQKLNEKKYDEERNSINVYKNDIGLEDNDDPFFNEYENAHNQYIFDLKLNPEDDDFCDYEDWLQKNGKLDLWKEWRDSQFEKNISKNGYGDWLKSDEGLYEEQFVTSVDEMNEKIKNMRKDITALAIHNHINKVNSNISYGSVICNGSIVSMENNFTRWPTIFSKKDMLGYTDVKEAFTEVLFPVMLEENLDKKDTNLNYSELVKDVLENSSKDVSESLSELYNQKEDESLISPALAYHYASKTVS
jgi:hypothetical protein